MLKQLGPYKIEGLLGRGGMGAVYEGVDESTGSRAAVKVLSPVLADDASFRERFKAEVKSLRKLRHPRIVQLYGYGEQEGHLFYAMELVAGANLQDQLMQGQRFDWREATGISIEICQALKHAHDHGVIHRDLKPANLIIEPEGHVKLTDFGIAKLFGHGSHTAHGGVLGTADFMAPEQAAGEAVTTRCDLYSLGCVMFALLAGRPPFRGKSMAEVIHQVRYDDPPRIQSLVRDVPGELDELIDKLLSKDPNTRVPTALALSNRLASMQDASTPVTNEGGANGLDGDVPAIADSNCIDPALARRITAPMHDGQEIISSTQVTQVQPIDEETQADGIIDAANHFTTVDTTAEERVGKTAEGPSAWLIVLLCVLLVVFGISTGVRYVQRPPTADQLFARINSATETDDWPVLLAAEDDAELFKRLFPGDARYAEAARISERIALGRLQRRFESKARRSHGAADLSPIERAYLDAIHSMDTRPEETAQKLHAILDVFSNTSVESRDAARCLQLAKRQLRALDERFDDRMNRELPFLQERLEDAREMQAAKPEEARTILEGLIELYADKAWAEPVVHQARAALDPQTPPDG